MKISIQKKLDELGMTRYELAKRIGVAYPTIDNIYKETSSSIRFEILESICRELNCTPNDIIISDDPKLQQLFVKQSNIKNLS